MEKRNQTILRAVISSYIGSGEPVGSRYLSKKLDIRLSSATIRNIMSDLEEMGYLKQPHVSAGRVPTDKGYRFFVDCFFQAGPCAPFPPGAGMEGVYPSQNLEPDSIIKETSKALSDVSRYVGLVMAPRFINTTLKHIEFVKLRRKRVLAILVSDEGLIQNRLISTEREYTQKELDRIGQLLSTKYVNQPLREVRDKIVAEMAADKSLYDSLLERALSLCRETLSREGSEEGDLYVEGTSNILSLPEFADGAKMRKLFKAFEDKGHLVDLLERCIGAEGVKIFIGAENPYHEFQDFSLVTAPYRSEGKVLGVIGVLGPTRMEYQRIIPMVDYTARYLTRLLTDRNEDR